VDYVRLGDRRIAYTRRGSGDPLLLMMGMAGHTAIWTDALLDGLAADFDVVAYDNRGIGESTDVPGPFTIADLAGDAVAVLDHLGWDSAHVFGISMGGMAAQELVLTHPERVRGLVLGCTYGGGTGSSLEAPGPLQMLQAAASGNPAEAVRAGFLANLSPTYVADEANWRPFFDTVSSVVVPMDVVVRQAQAAFVHDTSARLPSITAPTLVIHGTADQMLDPVNGKLIASQIPAARLYTMDGVGHLFWWERPDESVRVVREHLLAQPTS
jgi:pimeloyl-ACP methyl ester carboxylesterase